MKIFNKGRHEKKGAYRSWITAIVLAVSGVTLIAAAPSVYDQVWGDRVEARLCALEELHGIQNEECVPSTTTTTQPSTTTTAAPTTTTSQPPTTTTTAATTTTTQAEPVGTVPNAVINGCEVTLNNPTSFDLIFTVIGEGVPVSANSALTLSVSQNGTVALASGPESDWHFEEEVTSCGTTTTTAPTTTTTSIPTTTTTVAPTTTTTAPTTTTTPPASTGNIQGTFTNLNLSGNVNLTGDVIVTGTLTAGPGTMVEGNGHQIMCSGCTANVQGTPTSTWSNLGNGVVTKNLTRDIVFNNISRFMFMNGAQPSTLKFFKIQNSGASALGFYPLHFHLNGNSTRGTIVEGVVVQNGAHHAFVPHGSHGITFKDTIAQDIAGDAYWWDPGRGENCSNDILYDHALTDHVTNNPGDDRGFRLAAFRLGCGSGNVIQNSLTLNVDPSHVADCAGYHWPEQDEGVWGFFNNASYDSACNGIFVWQNTNQPHFINDYVGDPIENGAYVNRYQFLNIDVDKFIQHANGRDGGFTLVEGGRIGTLQVERHALSGLVHGPAIYRDVAIGSVTVNSNQQPGWYVFENTGISCGDINYVAVHSQTRVEADGVRCRG